MSHHHYHKTPHHPRVPLDAPPQPTNFMVQQGNHQMVILQHGALPANSLLCDHFNNSGKTPVAKLWQTFHSISWKKPNSLTTLYVVEWRRLSVVYVSLLTNWQIVGPFNIALFAFPNTKRWTTFTTIWMYKKCCWIQWLNQVWVVRVGHPHLKYHANII